MLVFYNMREAFTGLLLIGFFQDLPPGNLRRIAWQDLNLFALRCKQLQEIVLLRFYTGKLIRRHETRIYLRTALARIAISF